MAIVEAINIPIGVTGQDSVDKAANSYEDLGDAVAKTQLEAEKLAQQFGINDARTQQAIKVAGRYKQEMEELDFAIDGARGGVDQLFRASQGVIAGFELAAGATALFGGESEELEKVLMKVQGAMAFSQGLKDLKEFAPAIKNVAKGFTGPLTKAIQGFSKASKAALASTGIGLLVVAVGSLVAYWDDIKEAVSGVSSEQKKLLKEQQASAAVAQEQLDSISQQENILKLQGKTEEDIQQIRLQRTKIAITELKAQLETQEQVKKSQIESAKRNKTILQGTLEFISAPLTLLLKAVDKVGKAFNKDFGLQDALFGGIAKMVFDPEEIEKEADESIKETNKQLNTLENNLAGYELQKRAKRKENAQKAKEDNEKEFQDWLALELEKQQAADDTAKYVEQRRQQDLDDQEEAFQAWLEYETEKTEIAEDNANYLLKKKEEQAAKEKQIQEDIIESLYQLIDISNAFLQNKNNELNKEFDNRIEQLKKLGKSEEEIAQMRDGELIRIEQRSKDNFEVAKKLQYAQTLLSTIQGTQDAFTTAQKSPLTALFPAYPFLQAAAAAAFGVAQLQQISQSSYDSKLKPSVSGASASASVPRFNAPQTRLPGTDEFTQVRRVYVTERDITNVQDKVKVTEKLSQF